MTKLQDTRYKKIQNSNIKIPTWYIIVKPEFDVSTKWVYENFDERWIKDKNFVAPFELSSSISLINDLEKVVLPKYPEVSKIKKRLVDLGCLGSQMSGSGPSVFGLAPDQKTAIKVFDEMKKQYAQTFLVEPTKSGVSS